MPGPAPSAASRMIDVALAHIAADGMVVSLDNIRMERIIEEAGVSRATAYRAWATRDQFLADVLVATVRNTTLIPETPDDIAKVLAAVTLEPAALLDPQARRDLVVEALRVSSDLDIRRVLASPAWRTYLSLSATYQGLGGSVREQVGTALVETARAFDERRAGIYANLAQLLGYRPAASGDPVPAFAALAEAAGALMTGIVTRALVDPAWLDERREATLFGASRASAWSMPERHLVGTVLASLEPDPTVEWSPERVAAHLERFRAEIATLMSLPSSPVETRS